MTTSLAINRNAVERTDSRKAPGRGDLTGVQDSQNHSSLNYYDAAGRLIAQEDALGQFTTLTYDAASHLIARMNPRGYTTNFTYDLLGRQIGVEDPLGYWVTSSFDSRSNLIARQDQLGYFNNFSYDAMNRRTGVQDALGYWTTAVYEGRGLQIAKIDPLGHITTTSWDVLQRPYATQLPDGTLWQTFFDLVGNPFAFISPLGAITTQLFDLNNRLIGRQDPLGRWHTLSYDSASRLLSEVDSKGQITTHLYVNCGDEDVRTYADGTRITFSYDTLRRLIGVSDTTGLFTLTYDALNRLTSFNAPNHPHGLPLSYGYDQNSNLKSVQGWFGWFTATYDHDDQMASLTDPGYASPSIAGGVNNYTHDPRGQVSRINFVNGSRVTTTFDALGRVSQLRHEASTSTEIAHVYLTYDAAGRPTLKQTPAGNTTWTYDAADQLLSEWGPASGLLTYGYDASHRRVLVQSPTAPWTTASYDAADELLWTQTGSAFTTLGYDANGSTTSVVGPTGSRTTYLWDAVNRLSSVTLPTGAISTQLYRYDDLRIGQLSSAGRDTFVYDRPGTSALSGTPGPTATPHAATAASPTSGAQAGLFGGMLGASGGSNAPGSAPNAQRPTPNALPNVLFWQRGGSGPQELFSYGANLLRTVGTNSTGATLNRQFHLDAQGNVVATTTSSQSVETTYQTDAWGNVLTGSANSNPAIYMGGLGYWQEAALGLDYVRDRWLNSGTGSWLSVDPVSSEPRYAYAHNQPTMRVDPSGRQVGEGVTPAGQMAQFYAPAGSGPIPNRLAELSDPYHVLMQMNAIFTEFDTSPTKAIEHIKQLGKDYWQTVVANGSALIRLIDQGFDPFEVDISVMGFDVALHPFDVRGAFKTLFSPMAQAYYQHLLRDVPKDYAGYLPPTSSGADFYSWFGGFIYGVVDALADQIPWQLLDQQRMAHEVLQSVEAIGRVIGFLRRSKNLFSDLFQAIRQYGTAFMKSLSTSMQNIQSQDYFAQGEKTGDVLTRVLLFLVGAVKNLAAFVAFFEREGGTIVKLLRKLLGGEAGTLEEGGGGGGHRPPSEPVGKPHGQEPVERSDPEQRRIDRERANAEALAERQRIKQERERARANIAFTTERNVPLKSRKDPWAKYQILVTDRDYEEKFIVEGQAVFVDGRTSDHSLLEAKWGGKNAAQWRHSPLNPDSPIGRTHSKIQLDHIDQARRLLILSDKIGVPGVVYNVAPSEAAAYFKTLFEQHFPREMAEGKLSVLFKSGQGM